MNNTDYLFVVNIVLVLYWFSCGLNYKVSRMNWQKFTDPLVLASALVASAVWMLFV